MNTETTRRCSKCKQHKHESEFNFNPRQGYCKRCMREYRKAREARLKAAS